MAIKIGINGFGRIGRIVLREGIKNPNLDFVAVNDITDAKTLAHLFKYDSIHSTWDEEVSANEDSIKIGQRTIKSLCIKDPSQLPWKDLGVDVAVESTGIFRDREKAGKHIEAGAKKVIITAPAKSEDITIVLGVNESKYDPRNHHIISNASCTTNCLAIILKVLMDNFGVRRGSMTTIHSYTNDQRVLDLQHKDLRRARAACLSMIPTTTGAAKAIGLVIPELTGKLHGISIRVPTPNVSLVDLAVELDKSTTPEDINKVFEEAANTTLAKYLDYCSLPLVSSDFNGNKKSAIFDATSTAVVDGNFAKVFAWYDNETGYSARVAELAEFMAQKGI